MHASPKAWYHACIPVIWNHIDLEKLPHSSHSTLDACRVALKLSNLDFIHLESLGHVQDVDTIQFIMEHPTVTRFELRDLLADRQPAL